MGASFSRKIGKGQMLNGLDLRTKINTFIPDLRNGFSIR